MDEILNNKNGWTSYNSEQNDDKDYSATSEVIKIHNNDKNYGKGQSEGTCLRGSLEITDMTARVDNLSVSQGISDEEMDEEGENNSKYSPDSISLIRE